MFGLSPISKSGLPMSIDVRITSLDQKSRIRVIELCVKSRSCALNQRTQCLLGVFKQLLDHIQGIVSAELLSSFESSKLLELVFNRIT